jgi:hypothetical protein
MLSGNPSYKVDSGATQQMFDQSVARPAIQQFQEITRPGIIEENVGNGTLWSSMRANAEAKAASDLESNLAGQKSQLLYQDELSRRDLAESGANRAAGLMPTALQNQSNIYQQAIQQGSIEQQIDQFGLTAAYQEWQRTRPENTPYLQMALNYLNTPTEMAYQPAQQTSTMASLVQLLAPLIGGMGQAAGQQMDWRKLILGQ